jgi:hypothetical protein
MQFRELSLSPWYLNSSRLHALTKVPIPAAAQRSINDNALDRVYAMRTALSAAESILQSDKVPMLPARLGDAKEGDRFLASFWGLMSFRGVSAAVLREQKGKPVGPGTFSGELELDDTDGPWPFSGALLNHHLYSQSARGLLSGRKRVLLMGEFEVQDRRIEVHPIIIGDIREDFGGFPMSWANRLRLYPETIDTFSKMSTIGRPTASQVRELLSIPEKRVKEAFAQIIGEPFVQKDWGGEASDLFSSALTHEGENLTAAFIFKGPSVPGPLHPSKMGKNGDQLVRAFDEPADVIVIQHCNAIPPSVLKIAEALAANLARPRKYCIIDGSDTYRLLRAYGHLG